MSLSDDFPTYVKDLLNRMDYVGNVPPSRKIGIKSRGYWDPEDRFTRPLRWWQGDNSDVTCDYIDKILQSLFQILSEHPSSKDKIRKTLIETTIIFRAGLVNLIRTYSDNPVAYSQLRTSLSILDVRIPESVNINAGVESQVGVSPIPRLSHCGDSETENQL